ncbi:MAG: haloacid dehalogenase-like hydrolase [Bacteroidetes bacterium]|nr:haloacid dehalogenase-like hydrolase [Bacteroidota bacterium]
MTLAHHPSILKLLEQTAHLQSPVRPLAVFDCDGTVIHGDIGEAVFFRQIEEFMFRVSPAELWPDYPRRDELDRLFRNLVAVEPAERRAHPDFEAFAEHLLSWYYDQLAGGAVAKGCADIVRLFAGFTVAEVRALAARTLMLELQAPLGSRDLGGRKVHSGVRFMREPLELMRVLQEHQFDIWAVSGSSAWSVEPVFERLGVPAHQVIGISLESPNGTLSGVAVNPIPIRADKVQALQSRDTRIPHLVASDSRNDIPLLLYSSCVKVWVNGRHRSKREFFAAVGSEPDERWLLIEEPTILHHN